jgi:DNA-binding SARP family transcriptional activator
MVGIQFARSTVVNFTILGPVTASWDEEAASLAPQHQQLLARLVYAGGNRVDQDELIRVLSLSRRPDNADGGLKRVVAELRARLKSVMPDDDPIPNVDHGYRLLLEERQADIFRFRAQYDEAFGRPSGEGVRLMRRALGEWAPDAAGLYGGCALRGLDGHWAASTRHRLGDEYRRAVIYCLQQEMNDGRHREVLAECERRGEAGPADVPAGGHKPQVALLDEEFIEVWLRAAYRCGLPVRAREVGQQALETAARLDLSADFWVRRLVERVAAEESRGSTPFPAPTATESQRPAMSAPAAPEPTAMPSSGSGFTFNNPGATIGQQIGTLTGSIINNDGSARRQQAGQCGATGPGEPDGDAGHQDV